MAETFVRPRRTDGAQQLSGAISDLQRAVLRVRLRAVWTARLGGRGVDWHCGLCNSTRRERLVARAFSLWPGGMALALDDVWTMATAEANFGCAQFRVGALTSDVSRSLPFRRTLIFSSGLGQNRQVSISLFPYRSAARLDLSRPEPAEYTRCQERIDQPIHRRFDGRGPGAAVPDRHLPEDRKSVV